MAQRLTYEFFDRMIRKHTPRDWKVSYDTEPGQDALAMADPFSKTIHIPYRDSIEVLLLFFHECGHIRFGHTKAANHAEWYHEYEAERYAVNVAIAEGVLVSCSRLLKSKAYVRKYYRRHLRVCDLYEAKSKQPATPVQLRWMGL